MILYLWFSRCTFSSDTLRLYIPIKHFQAGTRLIYLIVREIGPPSCQQGRDRAEPWLVPKSWRAWDGASSRQRTHVCHLQGEQKAQGLEHTRRKAVSHHNHAFGSGGFTLCLLYALYFPTLKMSVGQICPGMEKRGSCCCRSLTTDPVLVLTVNLQYWHAGSPTGENLTLNIPAVGLFGPPTLQITLWW